MVLFPGCKCCGDGVCCPPTQEYIDAFYPLVCGQDGDIYSISLVKTPGDFNGNEYGDSFATGSVGGAITNRIETPGIYWELESYLPESAIPNATGWTWERRYLTDISPEHDDDDRSVYFRLDFDGHGGNLYALFTIGCDLNAPDNLWLRLTVAGAGTGSVPFLDLLWLEIGGVRTEVLPDPGVRASELRVEVNLTKSQAASMQMTAGWSLLDWPHPPEFAPPQESFGNYELTLRPLPEPLQDWSCGPDFTLPECGGWACFECTPCLVVAFETAGTGDPANNTFHLGPYLTGHTAHAGRPYRFVEVGANCDGVDPDDPDGRYTWHGAGYITPDGTIGDPWIDYDPATGIYESSYPYRGYLRLQIGCDDPAGGDEYTAEYSDDCTDGPC